MEANETKYAGCLDGLRGTFIEMTLDQALSGSHQGDCAEDVSELVKVPEIAAQLDAIGPDTLRAAMKECGAWDTDELSDDDANRNRAVWLAACDIRENYRNSAA